MKVYAESRDGNLVAKMDDGKILVYWKGDLIEEVEDTDDNRDYLSRRYSGCM